MTMTVVSNAATNNGWTKFSPNAHYDVLQDWRYGKSSRIAIGKKVYEAAAICEDKVGLVALYKTPARQIIFEVRTNEYIEMRPSNVDVKMFTVLADFWDHACNDFNEYDEGEFGEMD